MQHSGIATAIGTGGEGSVVARSRIGLAIHTPGIAVTGTGGGVLVQATGNDIVRETGMGRAMAAGGEGSVDARSRIRLAIHTPGIAFIDTVDDDDVETTGNALV